MFSRGEYAMICRCIELCYHLPRSPISRVGSWRWAFAITRPPHTHSLSPGRHARFRRGRWRAANPHLRSALVSFASPTLWIRGGMTKARGQASQLEGARPRTVAVAAAAAAAGEEAPSQSRRSRQRTARTLPGRGSGRARRRRTNTDRRKHTCLHAYTHKHKATRQRASTRCRCWCWLLVSRRTRIRGRRAQRE
ncbi:hypothetical protein GGS23DRAFT_196208 [Durotheca rogersii]|uniref:uncharacterized protein n=1 Tax=Durotheca rogersii TaxID=419775 RepID=UPI00221E51B8|nr:uncharacterized protein GGS23DRAFT_196208 [Durotheca rogersii]KAI5867790.1 hypothetical protein GGS23DRAFT_196208 [Durotheca rogersii]